MARGLRTVVTRVSWDYPGTWLIQAAWRLHPPARFPLLLYKPRSLTIPIDDQSNSVPFTALYTFACRYLKFDEVAMSQLKETLTECIAGEVPRTYHVCLYWSLLWNSEHVPTQTLKRSPPVQGLSMDAENALRL